MKINLVELIIGIVATTLGSVCIILGITGIAASPILTIVSGAIAVGGGFMNIFMYFVERK